MSEKKKKRLIEGDINIQASPARAGNAPKPTGGALVEDTSRVGTEDGSVEVRPAGDGLVEGATDPRERKQKKTREDSSSE